MKLQRAIEVFQRGCVGVLTVLAGSQAWSVEVADGVQSSTSTAVESHVVSVPTSLFPSSSLTALPPIVNTLGTFNITINPGATLATNTPALAAFNRAAAQWESFIADPITVNINADLAPLAPGVLGSAGSVTLGAPYDTFRNAMVIDSLDEPDDGIVAFLPTEAQASFNVPVGFGLSGNLSATKANLKALGFAGLDSTFGANDATITFSTNFAFDFDNSDGVAAGMFDFESVAAHEIGHALGFTSTVDRVDSLLEEMTTVSDLSPTTLDLFRFADGTADDPTTVAEFTTATRSLLPGSTDVFDQILTGFGDAEVLLSTGAFNGDGRQASHFKDFLGLGIMDPTLAAGEIASITLNDLRAFDLIGYEVTAVPEPGTLLSLLGGGLLMTLRRRRT